MRRLPGQAVDKRAIVTVGDGRGFIVFMPDPLATVTDDLRSWFEADPSLSGRQLLDRLQAEHPGEYPNGLVRTVQRRLKNWRSALAHALVFGRDRAADALPDRVNHAQHHHP